MMRNTHLKRSLRIQTIDSIKRFQVLDEEYKEGGSLFRFVGFSDSESAKLGLVPVVPVGSNGCTTNVLGTVYVIVHDMVHETAKVSDSRLH